MTTPTRAEDAMERRVLAGLKAFQRRTVDYVFRQMYERPDPATRFLVADEVGLGKTLVARGVIARAIAHLRKRGTERIDVIYICSNVEIAEQNGQRLNVSEERQFARATRLTLLPRHLDGLRKNDLHFVSLTPATSFTMATRGGAAEERAVLFRLLEAFPDAPFDESGAMRVLCGRMRADNFRRLVTDIPRVGRDTDDGLDAGLADAFYAELRANPELVWRFGRLIDTDDLESAWGWNEQQEVIRTLRQALAHGCVDALEPDLVILDEFQRFRDLLDKPSSDDFDDIRHLAQRLFTRQDVRTLLLSATPYKMYTLGDEAEDNHYADFLKTAHFLMGDDETARLANDLLAFRHALLNVGTAGTRCVIKRKQSIERRLRRFMVRTERLASAADRNGMLADRLMTETRLTAADVRDFAVVDRVSRRLGAGDVTEYWKSAPYLLNFMHDYVVKRDLRTAADDPARSPAIAADIGGGALLPHATIEAYEPVEPGNARLRGLAADTVDAGAWRLLWLPPSLPYYEGRSPYSDPLLAAMTKRLIFSSWNVVPDAVSMLLSYDAERAMMRTRGGTPRNTADERAKLRGLLSIRRQDGRPAGMSTFGLLYPSVVLTDLTDPLAIVRELGGDALVDVERVLAESRRRIEEALEPLTRGAPTGGLEDQRWYWAAPLLLDRRRARAETSAWLAALAHAPVPSASDDAAEAADETDAWTDHVAMARSVVNIGPRFGRVPADLAHVLALVAIGAPGNCALRALSRGQGRANKADRETRTARRHAALRIAWGFRSLFNVPEVMALLRGSAESDEDAYWRRCAEEGCNGNLQAVLDEYLHLLPEWLGLLGRGAATVADGVAREVHDAVALRAVNYSVDELRLDDGGLTIEPRHMRVRFALRFGRDVSDERTVLRSKAVRSAFNSPFWPFVLTSTSVGQEGLDFHLYCHAIVHWNLPANPVDLEQREGRIHRYKGHAVRKNLAERHRDAAQSRRAADPWAAMFAAAARGVSRESRDIEPYWVYGGSARIDRYLPLLPLSRDVERFERLRRSLAAYRLVIGQPRQEDLLAYLGDLLPPDELAALVKELRIDLTPK